MRERAMRGIVAAHVQGLLCALVLCVLLSPKALAHNPGSVEIAQCTEILKDDPEDIPTRRRRAELFIAFGDIEDALKDCAFLFKRCAGDPWAWRLRGRVHAMAEDYERAVADFTKARKLGDVSKNLLILRAAAYRDGGHLPKAVSDLSTALAMEKQYSIYYERGEIYMSMKKYALAIADFEQFLKVQPTSILYENLAKACLGAGQYEKALRYADRAVAKTPNYPWNYLLRARILKKLKREKEVLRDLAAALAAVERNVRSEFGPTAFDLLMKARILAEMNRLDQALTTLDEAVEMEEEMPALYRFRAEIHRRLGHAELAKRDLAKVTALTKKLALEKKGKSG
jgi:tetratricopeptide (TPR) repeat protein